MTSTESPSANSAPGKYDFAIQGLFSLVSVGLGVFLLLQHRLDHWLSRPLGVFCFLFPALLSVAYIRKQYKFEKERTAFLDKVLGACPSVIFVFDWNAAKVYILNGGFPSLGLSPEEVLDFSGNLFFSLSTSTEFEKIMKCIEETAKGPNNKVTTCQWQLRAKDRSMRTFGVSHTLLTRDPESTLIIGFAEDITSHKNIEKYAAMKDLGASVAHDIANPLSIISGQVFALEKKVKQKDLEETYLADSLEKIGRNVKRITQTVDALRMLTRDDKNDSLADFTVQDLLEDVTKIWQQRLKSHGVQLEIQQVVKGLHFVGNRSQITSAIFNLISFSFHQIEAEKPADSKITIEVQAVAGHIEFVVSDAVPLSPQHHHLLDPQAAHDLGVGVDLGLSFSKGIAERHGGDLQLDTTSSCTRLIFRLPEPQEAKLAA